jgi:hypothetical protein
MGVKTTNAPPGDDYTKAIPIQAASAFATHSEGAAVAGHEIRRIEVASLDFTTLRTQEDFEHGQLPESLVEARDAIVSAQHPSRAYA